MRVRRPASAAMTDRAAVTLVLPTPPFPATMTSRLCEQKRAGSTCSFPSRRLSMRARHAPSRLAIASLLTGVLLGLSAPSHAAPAKAVDVIEVSGRIDPIVADFIDDSLRAAERGGSEALVIQLDSPGAVVSDAKVDALAAKVARTTVPVAVWVGASGARAYGGGAGGAARAGERGGAPPGPARPGWAGRGGGGVREAPSVFFPCGRAPGRGGRV